MAGCSTSSGIDALEISPETTSSVARPSGPVPKLDVAGVIAAQPAPEPEPAVTDAAPEPAAEEVEVPAEVIALAAPGKPTAAEKAISRSRIYDRKFRDAKPINFGKASPKKLSVHGVDVSRWQGRIDWPKLRTQGANFAYIKATDGADHLDPMFMKNWHGAAEAGIRRGAYHFFYWCRSAGAQADWFIRNVPKAEGALPPVLDVEWNGESRCKKRPSRKLVLEKMKVFLEKLERHYGQRPIIYTAPDFYRDNLRGELGDYPFWLRSVAAHPQKVYPDRKWVFWQYSGSGLSHGVSGQIDLNVFHGSEAAWQKWLGRHAG